MGHESSASFHQLYLCPRDLPSNFLASEGPSMNFLCVRRIFYQVSVHQRDLPSASANSLCICGTSVHFHQHFVPPWDIPKMFRVTAGHSVNFHQLSVHPRDYPSTFRAAVGPSNNLRELSVCLWELLSTSVNIMSHHGTFCQIPLTLRTFVGSSINILSLRGTFTTYQ